jgi:hypothetical protein
MLILKLANLFRKAVLIVAAVAFGCSAFLLVSRYRDDQVIKSAVSGHIRSIPGTGIFIEELNSWVYQNKGFRKNNGFFLVRALGPTPRQVLEEGGDCADKSRLLSTILRLYGIESTLVTLWGCERCGPTHVVVEARYNQGWMVADPVFDLVFPSGDFTYYGLRELRRNPALLIGRLNQSIRQKGHRGKIANYDWRFESYAWAKYINWDKYDWSRKLASVLARFDLDLYRMRRPAFLEDPKLILSGIAAAAGTTILLLWHLIARLSAKWRASPKTEGEAPFAGSGLN